MSESNPDQKPKRELGGSADIAEARDRFKAAAEFEEPQRKSTLAAKNFLAGNQWDEAIKIQRQGGIAIQGQPATPPRPCFVLDCVSEPHQQIVNAISASDFAVKIAPHDEDATDETAEILQGLIRQIQNDSRIDDPMTWAGSDAAGGGIGWAYVYPEYEDEDGEDGDDQKICIGRIPNCLSVYADPAAMKRDKSDMRYAFITQDMPKSEVRRRWPNADLKGLEDFRATGDTRDKEWVTDATIRIASYYHCEYEDGKCVVYCDTINAIEVLESEIWGGKSIPLIFVSGREINIDGVSMYHGVVQPAMGPQQMVNYAFNGAAEAMALEPKTPWIVAAGQVSNYDKYWSVANIYNLAYLPYDPVDVAGNQVPPPQRPASSQNPAAWAGILQMSLDAVRRVTSFDPALGAMPGRQMSADAIEMLQAQGQKGNSGYLDSMRRAYLRLGEILLEAIPVYYDRPGRVVKVLGLEDKADLAMLNMPHTRGPQGQPVPAMQQPAGQAIQQPVMHYDLTKGCYSCTVEVGKAYATKREEGVAALAEFAKVQPELVPRYADLWVKEMDFPGAQAVAMRLAPPGEVIQGLPPQAQQLVQSLQQQVQQLQGQIQSKTAEIQTKGQIDMAKQSQSDQVKYAIADMQSARAAQAGIAEAEIKAGSDRAALDVETLEIMLKVAKEERLAKEQLGHEATMAAGKQTHEILGKALDHAHDHAMAEKAHAHAIAQSQQDADEAQAAQAQSAALNPPQPDSSSTP